MSGSILFVWLLNEFKNTIDKQYLESEFVACHLEFSFIRSIIFFVTGPTVFVRPIDSV